MTYALSRATGPDGDTRWDTTRNTWTAAESPVTETIRGILNTPQGQCLVDETSGVRWDRIDKLRTDAGVTAEAEIRAALKRFLDSGEIRELAVNVEVYPARDTLLFDVAFFDVKLKTRKSVKGSA